MRIAHFVPRYPPALGGSEAYFARLSRNLATAGDQVSVVTTTAVDLEAFWHLDARCSEPGTTVEDEVEVSRHAPVRWPGRRYFLKALSLWPNRFWQCLTLPCNPIAPSMWHACGRTDRPFDVIHATAFPYAFPIACALRLARRLKVPFLVTPFLHLGDPDDPRDPTRRAYTTPALMYLLNNAHRVFVQTTVERDALLERGLSSDRVVLQGLGVDPAECTGGDRARARQAWGSSDDEVVVGHLANLSAEKGSVDLLRAAELAWRAGATFRLVLAGPAMPNFRRVWERFPEKGRVQCLGILSDEQKCDFFAGIDLFALPSRSDSFGLVLLEAWANGVPNLAYRAGGIAGVIRHEEDGVLIRCGDVPALADTLTRLVGDAQWRWRLGTTGRSRLACDYRWEDKLALVREVYEEVSNKKTPGSVRS